LFDVDHIIVGIAQSMVGHLTAKIALQFGKRQQQIKTDIDERFKTLSKAHVPGRVQFLNGIFDISLTQFKWVRAAMADFPFCLKGIFNKVLSEDKVVAAFIAWNSYDTLAHQEQFRQSSVTELLECSKQYATQLAVSLCVVYLTIPPVQAAEFIDRS
jgi:hypothetical protein